MFSLTKTQQLWFNHVIRSNDAIDHVRLNQRDGKTTVLLALAKFFHSKGLRVFAIVNFKELPAFRPFVVAHGAYDVVLIDDFDFYYPAFQRSINSATVKVVTTVSQGEFWLLQQMRLAMA